MKRIEINYGGYVYCDNMMIDNIYSIDIIEEDETIELNGVNGFVEGWIRYYHEVEEVGVIPYNNEGNIDSEQEFLIIKNGKVVI